MVKKKKKKVREGTRVKKEEVWARQGQELKHLYQFVLWSHAER